MSRSPRWAACSRHRQGGRPRGRGPACRDRGKHRPAPQSVARVINAIAAHHQEVEYTCLEAPIVQIADAISASRPGARGESMDTYVKRLEDLQAIAESFGGWNDRSPSRPGARSGSGPPEEIDDLTASRLARDIVKKIEEQLTYPARSR